VDPPLHKTQRWAARTTTIAFAPVIGHTVCYNLCISTRQGRRKNVVLIFESTPLSQIAGHFQFLNAIKIRIRRDFKKCVSIKRFLEDLKSEKDT
jgi:hypothetical protein